MKLNIHSNYENSPKTLLIQKLTTLFASYEVDRLNEYLSADISWTLVGHAPIKGIDRFAATLHGMSETKTAELTIHQIITHSNEAAVHGEMLLADGNTYGFGDFYRFNNADFEKVQSIVSYVVQK